MWTESEIKQYLDGNYWFFDHDGRLHHQHVPGDFIPDHNGKAALAACRNLDAINAEKKVHWPPNSLEIIQSMRLDGISWAMIGALFGCGATNVNKYYQRQIRKKQMEREDYEARHDAANR
jgi:hypothetical protein